MEREGEMEEDKSEGIMELEKREGWRGRRWMKKRKKIE